MKKVSDIFLHKERKITAVSPSTSVLEALRIMSFQNIGSVMVMDNQTYLGIMTERDYSRKVILKGKSSTDTPVSEIMSNDLPAVNLHDSIDRIFGIVSIHDLIRETIQHQQETISQLKDYLHASM